MSVGRILLCSSSPPDCEERKEVVQVKRFKPLNHIRVTTDWLFPFRKGERQFLQSQEHRAQANKDCCEPVQRRYRWALADIAIDESLNSLTHESVHSCEDILACKGVINPLPLWRIDPGPSAFADAKSIGMPARFQARFQHRDLAIPVQGDPETWRGLV